MRKISFRTMLAGVALVAGVTAAAAQDRSSLLTSVEVNRLVAKGQPADHAQLRDHFVALAGMFAFNAGRHEAAAQTLTGNPNHPPAVSPGARYLRIAEQERESAATLRALAAYHDSRAAGRTATFPEMATRFERGDGAPTPTAGQIRELVASARTAADHQALETYFTSETDRYLTLAHEHATQARIYRLRAYDRSGTSAVLALHCEREAAQAQKAADSARTAAAEQRRASQRG